MSKTRASCFIKGSKHLETVGRQFFGGAVLHFFPKQMQVLGLRPRAFICFSVFGTRHEALALVFDILNETNVSSVSPSPVS